MAGRGAASLPKGFGSQSCWEQDRAWPLLLRLPDPKLSFLKGFSSLLPEINARLGTGLVPGASQSMAARNGRAWSGAVLG